MAFNTREISNQDGKPVGLYDFRYGSTHWRYTTNVRDLTVAGNTWSALALSDSGVSQGGSDQNDIQISIRSDNPITELFKAGKPSGKVWLTVRRYHLGDADSETPIFWIGTITNSIRIDSATEQLNGRSLGGTYDRNGLRLPWGRMCPHPLYGPGCFVDPAAHAYARTIASVTNTNFSCTAHDEPAEGSFSGGYVEWSGGTGETERKFIELQSGNDFRVLGSTVGLSPGMNVVLYPGCPRNTEGCILFDNLPNYGGFPHLPGKSPFDGTPLY